MCAVPTYTYTFRFSCAESERLFCHHFHSFVRLNVASCRVVSQIEWHSRCAAGPSLRVRNSRVRESACNTFTNPERIDVRQHRQHFQHWPTGALGLMDMINWYVLYAHNYRIKDCITFISANSLHTHTHTQHKTVHPINYHYSISGNLCSSTHAEFSASLLEMCALKGVRARFAKNCCALWCA